MINRIVKMVFKSEKVDDFKTFIKPIVPKIADFEGCSSVEILQDINKKNVFFTYSLWESENTLEKYRNSALFNSVWSETKKMFAEKPYAWSTELVEKES